MESTICIVGNGGRSALLGGIVGNNVLVVVDGGNVDLSIQFIDCCIWDALSINVFICIFKTLITTCQIISHFAKNGKW